MKKIFVIIILISLLFGCSAEYKNDKLIKILDLSSGSTWYGNSFNKKGVIEADPDFKGYSYSETYLYEFKDNEFKFTTTYCDDLIALYDDGSASGCQTYYIKGNFTLQDCKIVLTGKYCNENFEPLESETDEYKSTLNLKVVNKKTLSFPCRLHDKDAYIHKKND